MTAPMGDLWAMRSTLLVTATLAMGSLQAQCDGWQQRISCRIAVDLDVRSHRFSGTEHLVYRNNSPDSLGELFFHLYPNAFKPGSEMDVRSRTIADPDPRVGDRIAALGPDEEGDLRCTDMRMDGRAVPLEHMGTVLRATLPKALPPGDSAVIDLDFQGQVPVQIRRSGRDNAEGIAYSMGQWYPKVAVYDRHGWHADPYVGREFYGEWGDHDLRITLDSSYTVAATGILMNAAEIGHGYAPRTAVQQRTDGKLTWHFHAERVHDLAWTADPDYKVLSAQVPDGPLLRFFYQGSPAMDSVWLKLPAYMVQAVQLLSKNFGTYPWPVFTVAQGGDQGMEYNMLTMVNGERRLGGLIGTGLHELCHQWYYGVLASNESAYPWMDEGFSEYAGEEVLHVLLPASKKGRDHQDALNAYKQLAVAGPVHEPMSTAADHFSTNYGYAASTYSKGEFFLDQLGAVIGDSTLHRGLLRYFRACAFKHPEPVDVQRAMEKESGLQLGWYFDEWIRSVRLLDLAVDTVEGDAYGTTITLLNKGSMIMPADVALQTRDGDTLFYNIPLSLMLGARQETPGGRAWKSLKPWLWTSPGYTFDVPVPIDHVQQVMLDPLNRTGDMDLTNNRMRPARSGYPEERP